jgi:hypothetical protein
MYKRSLTILLTTLTSLVVLLLAASPARAQKCESWCGSCGYTFISCGSYCPSSSQCSQAGSTDLRQLSGGGSNTTANTTPPTQTYTDPNNGTTVSVAQPGTIATVGNPTSVTSTSTIGTTSTSTQTTTTLKSGCPSGYISCGAGPDTLAGCYAWGGTCTCSQIIGQVPGCTGLNRVAQNYDVSVGSYQVNTEGMTCNSAGTCTLSQSPGIAGDPLYLCSCPHGLPANGICTENCVQVGTATPGQTVDMNQLLGDSACGAYQFDVTSTGANGAFTVNTGKVCTTSAPPAAQIQSISNTSTTVTVSEPTPTPTPPPFVCLSVSKDIESPRYGQSVRFTCGTVTAATHYEFQYKVGTESGTIAPQNAGANVTIPFAITKLGSYKAQCRPCTATECAPWAETF